MCVCACVCVCVRVCVCVCVLCVLCVCVRACLQLPTDDTGVTPRSSHFQTVECLKADTALTSLALSLSLSLSLSLALPLSLSLLLSLSPSPSPSLCVRHSDTFACRCLLPGLQALSSYWLPPLSLSLSSTL